MRTLMMMAAAMLAWSCSNDSVIDKAQENEIHFNTNLHVETRASFTADNFAAFNVTALGNGGTYFANALVSRATAGSWFTDRTYYWPTYELSFYGYAPTDLSSQVTLTPTAQTVNDFTPEAAVADQKDIVAAYSTGTKEHNAATGVNMHFMHQLAQIEVMASNEDASTFDIAVLGVKLGRIPVKATLTLPAAERAHGTWSTPTAQTSYGIKGTTPITLDGSMQSIMFGSDNWLMIPQQLTGMAFDESFNDNQGAYLAVLCRITDKTGQVWYPVNDPGQTEVKYAYAAVSISTRWEVGRKYTYRLKFFSTNGGAGCIDPVPTNPLDAADPDVDPTPCPDKSGGAPIIDSPITFNVSIEDWIAGNDEQITIEN